jgi:hypothetical protein
VPTAPFTLFVWLCQRRMMTSLTAANAKG